ncbi:MAG: hypothetical protein WB952_17480 [Terriglobales bacterium]
MGFKTPEEELEQFLAAQPSWLRKLLQFDFSLTFDEHLAWTQSDWWQEGGKVEKEYLRLLQRIPNKWREHRGKVARNALSTLPSARSGRPRRDLLAEEAKHLHEAGKSYAEVADILRDKYTTMTAKGKRHPTREGIRKLLDSRKPRRTPDKT